MKKFTLIFTLMSFFSLGLIAQTIKYDRNLDGSYKSMFVIQNDKQTKVKPETNKDGTYKGLYVTFVGDSIQVDTILSLSKNNNGKIRYNPTNEKWQFSNNGLIWYDFVTEGGGGGGGGISGSGTTGTIAKWNTSSSLTDSSISETTPTGRTTGNAFNSDTYIESGLFIKVVSEKPSAPPAGHINIYYRNGSMYYQDSTGTETKMCETVISGDAYYETDIVFNFNGNNGQGYCNSNTNYGRLRRGNTLAMSSASLSTSDKKYGSASLHIDQTQYGAAGFAIDNPNGFDLLDDEWCWEAWIKISSASISGNTLLSSGSGGDSFTMGRNSYSLCYFMPTQDTYQLFFNATVDGITVASYYADFSSDISGSWHHLAVERDKNHSPQLRVFLDGEEQSITTNTAFTSTPIKTVGFLSIGCGNMTPEGFNGYIDDLRFRRSCPYTTNFTPPGEW